MFTSVALFSILISPLNAFPWVINGLVEAWVSTKRVQAFLNLTEQGGYYYISGGHEDHNPSSGGQEDVIRISHGYFTWSRETPSAAESHRLLLQDGGDGWTLTDINLAIKPVCGGEHSCCCVGIKSQFFLLRVNWWVWLAVWGRVRALC